MFQSPSLRGSGHFGTPTGRRSMRQSSFNPLHCGAVVTSLNAPLAARRGGKVSIPFIAGQWSLLYPLRDVKPRDTLCFNPLHCGAVVTSPSRALRRARRRGAFQSPSLRGSGHFALAVRRLPSCPFCFNPLHCGAVVASCGRCGRRRRRRPVSIPFIAGQWSLPGGTPPDPIRIGRGFQSPSLRGSGRFVHRSDGAVVGGVFQSPSLRGSGRFRATSFESG